jgi:hypothetical protein
MLFTLVDQVRKAPALPLEIYEGDTRENYEEVTVRFLRGRISDYPDIGSFWIKVLQHIWERDSPYRVPGSPFLREESMLFQEISQEDFLNLLAAYGGRLFPYDLRLRGQFQQAWSMCDAWDEQAALAYTDNEYVAFLWYTTA